jgi:hypothetical protein
MAMQMQMLILAPMLRMLVLLLPVLGLKPLVLVPPLPTRVPLLLMLVPLLLTGAMLTTVSTNDNTRAVSKHPTQRKHLPRLDLDTSAPPTTHSFQDTNPLLMSRNH